MMSMRLFSLVTFLFFFSRAAVEKHGKICFDTCPKPLNQSTDCYLDCYRNTLMGDASQNLTAIDPTKMIEPWENAFLEDDPSKGGCKSLPPPEV